MTLASLSFLKRCAVRVDVMFESRDKDFFPKDILLLAAVDGGPCHSCIQKLAMPREPAASGVCRSSC